MNNDSASLRRVRFRLQRQGMLELDRWLMPLTQALDHDPRLLAEIEALLAHEPAVLQRMMAGEIPVPERLRSWLA